MLTGIKLVRDVPYTGAPGVDVVGAVLSVVGMGGIVLSILVWQEGGEYVAALLVIGAAAMAALVWWLRRRKRQGAPTLIDPDLFKSTVFRFGISQQMLQQIALGGTMIALPIYLQMVLEYSAMQAGLSMAPLSLTMFATALLAGRKAGDRRPSSIIRAGFMLLDGRHGDAPADRPRADSGWYLVVPLMIAGSGLGLLVSQLNNYTLAPISEERVSEAAGVNSAAGSFGLSFGLAFAGAIMLATLSFSFTNLSDSSTVLHAARAAAGLQGARARRRGHDQHRSSSSSSPASRRRPRTRSSASTRTHGHRALQVALLVPILAGLVGLFNSFRMMRLPDPKPSSAVEGVVLG